MKQYQLLKSVYAEPCTKESFDKLTQGDLCEKEENGYVVMSADGYKSWCPKSTFERDFQCAATAADRVKNESDELFARWVGLTGFIDDDKFCKLDPMSQKLLQAQADTMEQYGRILDTRLPIMNGDEINVYEKQFDFGTVVKLLKAGALVCRKGWNGKGMFVVKQVPAHITGEIIPNMQSLPDEAKNVLMSRKDPQINYTSQCLLVQKDGRADSWVPSISDVFAEDWTIYSEK